ncbi:hypothetical protein [Actinophytocola sediminis]
MWDGDLITVPGWDELAAAFLSQVARWVFGTGVVSNIIIVLLSVIMISRGGRELYRSVHEALGKARGLAGVAARFVRRVTDTVGTTLRTMPRVMVLFNVSVTVSILSLNGVWLIASWGISASMTNLWNAYIWSSWELPGGVPWQSFTGFYTLVCVAFLFAAWLFPSRDNRDSPAIPVAFGAALAPVLLAAPLFGLLVLGTPLNLAYSLLVWLPRGSAAWEQWDGLGELWLYIGAVVAYSAATVAAMKLAARGAGRWRTASR